MASEEPEPRQAPQPGEARCASAPVISAALLASTDTSTISLAAAGDTVSVSEGPAATAVPASQGVSGSLCEHSPSIGGHGDETTCRATEKANEHNPEVSGANVVQPPPQQMIKVEQQRDEAGIPTSIPPIAATAPKEGQADLTNPVKAEEVVSGLPVAFNPPREPKKITLDKLRQAADGTGLAKLEADVETAKQIATSIRVALADSKQLEQSEWIKAIDKLETKSKRTRTVVAVAGSTGAGKSSLLNAVLDVPDLLSVSCYRACTSVVTEVSYNEDDDPQKAYRVEVEFILPEDWESELALLFGDLVEGNQLSPAHRDANTEANVALSKIKAVYPDLTHEKIVKSRPEKLAKSDQVLEVLGRTRKFSYSNARELHSKIQVYLDSKDRRAKGDSGKPQGMAYWPLIKVVRVYCKADALSTGLTLVDLPGIYDSNEARSAVASRYMAECSALWVAAPIKRAVDDKSAKDLLGKGSRLQLKLDGIYSNVTFICTMTDGIQREEALEAFDSNGAIQTIISREDDLDKEIQETKINVDELKQQIEVATAAVVALDEQQAVWEELEQEMKKGKQVYAPRVPAKRKRSAARNSRRKAAAEDDAEDKDTAQHTPLTIGDISSKLAELEATVTTKESECTEMEKRLEVLETALVRLQDEKNDISGEGTRRCIQKRNERVCEVIRDDFAAGIREIDEEDAQADEETYDPSIQKRDYDEVARALSVYCISSKAYQQLCGRTKRDALIEGFKDISDTEIPLLQDHAKRLPEKNRILAHKSFLNEFFRLLSSLVLWVNSSTLELNVSEMSAQDQSYEMKHLHAVTENLKKNLDMLILEQKENICTIVQNQFNSKSTGAISHASKAIEGVVRKWGATKDDGGYGMPCNTYRAICRRYGAKTKSEKARDFNEDILEPYLLKVSSGWEQAFSRSIPVSFDNFVVRFMEILKDWYRIMISRPELEKCKMASLKIIAQQIDSHEAKIRDMVNGIKTSIQAEQRQVSRAFLPEVRNEMSKIYPQCANEKGRGCFLRVKEHMSRYTFKNKSTIYRKATQRVTRDLYRLFESNRKDLQTETHELVDTLEGDFRTVISSSAMIEASEVARDHIRGVLEEVDSQFSRVMDPMDTDPAQSPHPVSLTVSADSMAPGAPQIVTSEDMVIDP